jgi:hypothetical protein
VSVIDQLLTNYTQGNRQLSAHKLVLATRSVVFATMFTQGRWEAQRLNATKLPMLTIPIPNMASSTFDLLLDFIYGVHLAVPQPMIQDPAGTCPLFFANTSLLGSAVAWVQQLDLGIPELCALMGAADQYDVPDLVDACSVALGMFSLPHHHL